MKDWPDEIHRIILDLNGLMNRPDFDAAFLARAGVKLDRALFPLLSRIGVVGPVTVVELANLVGRDHSTVSRQVAKLIDLRLVTRFAATEGRKPRLLRPTEAGRAMLLEFSRTRHQIFEQRLVGWSDADKSKLIDMLRRLYAAFDELRLEAALPE